MTPEERRRLGQVGGQAGARVAAEGVGIGGMSVGARRGPGPGFAPAFGAGAEGEEVEHADADPDLQARGLGLDSRDDLAEEPGAVLQAAAVAAGPRSGGEEFVPEITVAMLEVDEMESGALRPLRRAHVILDQSGDRVIGENPRIVSDPDPAVAKRAVPVQVAATILSGCPGDPGAPIARDAGISVAADAGIAPADAPAATDDAASE